MAITPLKMKTPAHPGGVLKGILKEARVPVTEAAKALEVSRVALSRLVNEESNLSWEMAIRISKAFGGSASMWMRMQFHYDEAQMETKAKAIKVKAYRPLVQVAHDA